MRNQLRNDCMVHATENEIEKIDCERVWKELIKPGASSGRRIRVDNGRTYSCRSLVPRPRVWKMRRSGVAATCMGCDSQCDIVPKHEQTSCLPLLFFNKASIYATPPHCTLYLLLPHLLFSRNLPLVLVNLSVSRLNLCGSVILALP